MDTAFWILSAITIVGAVLAISLRNLVHCVLSLILFFLGIAGHYFLLRAEFLGAAQILVYIGAVAILILFAIMLTRNVTGIDGPSELGGKWWAGVGIATIIGGSLWTVIREDTLGILLGNPHAESTVKEIGVALVTDWVLPFEIMGLLLTVALIGAVVIALEEVSHRE